MNCMTNINKTMKSAPWLPLSTRRYFHACHVPARARQCRCRFRTNKVLRQIFAMRIFIAAYAQVCTWYVNLWNSDATVCECGSSLWVYCTVFRLAITYLRGIRFWRHHSILHARCRSHCRRDDVIFRGCASRVVFLVCAVALHHSFS